MGEGLRASTNLRAVLLLLLVMNSCDLSAGAANVHIVRHLDGKVAIPKLELPKCIWEDATLILKMCDFQANSFCAL